MSTAMMSLLLTAVAAEPAAAEPEAPSTLMSLFAKLGSARNAMGQIDRQTWADMTFSQRVASYDWTLELVVLAVFVLYAASFLWGTRRNAYLVERFMSTVRPVLNSEFGVIGASVVDEVVRDSTTRYTTYASGRLNIESLTARFRLSNRQNVIMWLAGNIVPQLGSDDGFGDHIEIDLIPTDPSVIESGIFGVVNKEHLAETRPEHYYVKYTKIADSDQLPSPSYVFMHEHSDQIGLLYTPELRAALALPGADRVLRLLAFSDLPDEEPTTVPQVTSTCKVHLSLNFPGSAAEEAAAKALLEASIGFVDALVEKTAYRVSTAKRIKTTREAEVARIVKAEEAVKAEELELKRAEERREAARKESTLSEKEQRRLKKKEQEKQARKQRSRMSRRG